MASKKLAPPRRLVKTQWEAFLNTLAAHVLGLRKIKNSRVEVFLLDERGMRQLAKLYLNKDKSHVDVLAFPQPKGFPQPEGPGRLLGEVYLNWEVYRHDRERLKFLLVHGVLHLLGYKHERRADIARMEGLERRLCRALPKLK